MENKPTDEQVEAAKKLVKDDDFRACFNYDHHMDKCDCGFEWLASFLASHDAEKDRTIAGLRKEFGEVRAYVKTANEKLGLSSENAYRFASKIEFILARITALESALAEEKAKSERLLAAYSLERGELRDENATLRARVEELEKSWRCFHCSEVFATEQEASDHFAIEGIPPACVDPLTKDEKARAVVMRKLESEIAKLQRENEDLDHLAGCLHSYESELGRYFGKCGGGPVKTPHQAYLVYEATIGRAEAAEARVKELEADKKAQYNERVKLQAVINANEQWLSDKGFKSLDEAEAKLSSLLAPVSDAEEREALGWDTPDLQGYGRLEDGSWGPKGTYWAPKPGTREMAIRVLARLLRQSRAKLAEVEADLHAAHIRLANSFPNGSIIREAQMEHELNAANFKLAAVEKERDNFKKQSQCLNCGENYFNVSLCSKCSFSTSTQHDQAHKVAALEADLGRARGAMRRAGEYLGAGQSREAWDRLLVFLDTHPSPAPVAPKPSDSYLVGGDEFFCCKDQDNPCHPINDYCSSGRERVAPTPCCLQVQAGIAPGHSLDCQAPQEGN